MLLAAPTRGGGVVRNAEEKGGKQELGEGIPRRCRKTTHVHAHTHTTMVSHTASSFTLYHRPLAWLPYKPSQGRSHTYTFSGKDMEGRGGEREKQTNKQQSQSVAIARQTGVKENDYK